MKRRLKVTRAGLRYIEGLKAENRRLAEELELAKLREQLLWEQLQAFRETVAWYKTHSQLGALIGACDMKELQDKRTRLATPN